MNQADKLLSRLKKILSVADMRYQLIADKLGLEILQCGIDYFNNSDDADAAAQPRSSDLHRAVHGADLGLRQRHGNERGVGLHLLSAQKAGSLAVGKQLRLR